MRIHHLNCGCMCPLGGALYDGFSKGLHAHLICHCLLIETERDGLVLVDTGFGEQDMTRPRHRLSGFFRMLNNIQYRRELTALYQIQQRGFQASDVRHIILTHLDFDHAGGITDFPQARLHVMRDEIATAKAQHTWLDRRRYADSQWRAEDGWHSYSAGGERWFGFEAVRDLDGLPPEILMIPLPGHTPGHAGIAIQDSNGWLLHGGDAWFYRGEMDAHYHCTPGLRFYQWMMEKDRRARLENQHRLRVLAQEQKVGVTLFCSHDAKEYERLQHR